MSVPLEVGFYGKLPSHGDFLRRRVSDPFVRRWDTWLQECLLASRAALGDRWRDVYLTSPAWRFACAAGACGPVPVIGLMVPSVDSVGRYFPLTLVVELPDSASTIALVAEAEPFFDTAERMVIETLETERIDLARFDERVQALASELEASAYLPRIALDPTALDILESGHQASWRMPIGSAHHVALATQELLAQRLEALYKPVVLWWTDGSSMVDPSFLIERGLPAPNMFTALLDGSWSGAQWTSVSAHLEPGAALQDTAKER